MTEPDLLTRVHPFSNGSEYFNWQLNNCYECKWGSFNNDEIKSCPVEFMFDKAYDTDGLVRPWYVYVAGIGKGGKCRLKEDAPGADTSIHMGEPTLFSITINDETGEQKCGQ